MTTPKPMELKQYERSYCDCKMCTSACKAMPGMLAPGDLDDIIEFSGVTEEREEEWVADHFAASEGSLVKTHTGEIYRIPTIVPKQKPNGHCVFLDEKNHCKIHPVSPFGCRCFNVCETDPERNMEQERQSQHALACITGDIDYNSMHQWMSEQGHLARPLHERKRMLLLTLEAGK